MSRITWIASYPKSGNTWLRMFLTKLLQAEDLPVNINDIFINNFSDRKWWDDISGWETSEFRDKVIASMRFRVQEAISLTPGERYFKTHDAFYNSIKNIGLFSKKAARRSIYIIRNPLDIAISFSNHVNQPIDLVIKRMNDRCNWFGEIGGGAAFQIPQFLGDWSSHVASWTENVEIDTHTIRYEDMLGIPKLTFSKIANFLELNCSEDQIESAIKACRFESLQEQELQTGFREKPKDCGRFFNFGRAGRWREVLSPSQINEIFSAHHDMMKRYGY